MKAKKLVVSVVAIVAFGMLTPVAGWGQDVTEYQQLVTQTDFATGLVAAILGQVRTSIDDAEAMTVLKDKGLVPADWTGAENVTMGEVDDIFHRMGFRVEIEDAEDVFLTQGVFEQILRNHMGEIKRTRHHWDIVHYFSVGLELGEYRGRLLGPSAENPYGINDIVSPSDF